MKTFKVYYNVCFVPDAEFYKGVAQGSYPFLLIEAEDDKAAENEMYQLADANWETYARSEEALVEAGKEPLCDWPGVGPCGSDDLQVMALEI